MKKVKWKQINWEQAETYINRLQIRIVKAVKENKWRLVKRLQYLITHSFCGKAVAVRRVISNKGKNTPGIDGIVWKTDKEKEEAIRTLETKGYRASALRRIYIEKFGKKRETSTGYTYHERPCNAGITIAGTRTSSRNTCRYGIIRISKI